MGAVLRLAYRTFGGFDRALRRQIVRFRERHPEVEVVRCDFDLPTLHELLVSGDGCVSGEWDLFLCVTDWLPQLMTDGRLLPLDPHLESDPPEAWPDGWSRSLLEAQTGPDGRVYGIPYHDGPEIFIYRADLFADPLERRSFEARHGRPLAPPETWSQFLEVARFFTRPERGLYGCVLAGMPDGHNSVYDFLIQLWSRGGELLAGSRAAFAGREGSEALRFLTDLVRRERVTQPDPLDYESVRAGECYAGGTGAMMWNWSGSGVVADMPPSRVLGRNGYGLIPRGDGPGGRHVSLNVYWLLTIPRGCRHPDAAWAFLRSCASAEMDRVTSVEGGIGARLSTWRDPELRQRFPCYAQIEETHRGARTLPPVPQLDAIIHVLNRWIDRAHTGRAEPEAALAAAAQEVDALLAQGGAGDPGSPGRRPQGGTPPSEQGPAGEVPA